MAFTVSDAQRAKVVERALAQVGKEYVYGATGPQAYDCSGSTLEAWRPYLRLTHQSGAQLHDPHVRMVRPSHIRGHVARYWLKPGDLVFYYGKPSVPSTVTHVALYVGKKSGYRWVVNATNEQRGVERIKLFAYAKPCAYGFVGH